MKNDGEYPYGPVIVDAAGNLYGTTFYGGTMNATCTSFGSLGCGTVFKLTPAGKETILYKFQLGADGAWPAWNLIRDNAGNLYGSDDDGVFFEIGPCKKLSHLKAAVALHFAFYNFCRVHSSIRCTPAMEAGIADHIWGLEELLA